jgi:hypothetical protein
MHWNVVDGLRLGAVIHPAISNTVWGASICTLSFEFVTTTALPAVFRRFCYASSSVHREEQLLGVQWWAWIIACAMAVLTTAKVGRDADMFLGSGVSCGRGRGYDVTVEHYRPRNWKKNDKIVSFRSSDMLVVFPSRGLKGGDFDILLLPPPSSSGDGKHSRHAAKYAICRLVGWLGRLVNPLTPGTERRSQRIQWRPSAVLRT